MAFPKKRRGFRLIVVDEGHYRWRFSTRDSGFLTVIPEVGQGRSLVVILPEWLDPWLHAGDVGGSQGHVNTPAQVTPAFAEQAVRQALGLGWRPGAAGPAFELEFVGGQFRAVRSSG